MRLPGMNDDNPTTDPLANTQDPPVNPGDLPKGFSAIIDEGPKKSGSSAVVLIALIAVSGAVLWGMRHLGTRGSINLVDISIDYPVKDKSTNADHTEVIRALRESNDIPQVAPQMIAMNPFTWKASDTTTVDNNSEEQRELERLRRAHEQRMRAIDTAANNMRLNSVMRGRVPIANVSGELVAVGDDLGEYFTVTRIEGREVEIEAEGRTWVLTVGGQ